MVDVARINSEFEGRTLTTLTDRGRPCWIAREIGRFLGYSHDGRRLPAKITGRWSEHLLEDYDYAVLQGAELEAFRAALLVGDTGSQPSRSHRRLVLLYEPGLHLVLARTSKPVAHRLRRFLVDEVLPHVPHANANANASANGARSAGTSARSAIANASVGASANREESVKPGVESAEPGVEPVEPAESVEPGEEAGSQATRVVHLHLRPRKVRILDVQLMREHRLTAQHDLRKRMFQAASLRNTVQTLSQLGVLEEDDVQVYEVLATEIAFGLDVDEMMAELGPSNLFPREMVSFDEVIRRLQAAEERSRARWDRPEDDADETDDPTTSATAE